MKYIIFSDIHGNLPALEWLLGQDADCFCFLGDAVNYGPWQDECVQLIDQKCFIKIRGNNEEYFINHKPEATEICNEFYNVTLPFFSKYDIIKNWNKYSILNDYVLMHTVNNQIVYPDSKPLFNNNYIIGHSHHQSFHKNESGFKLYAIGAAGQNRRNINEIDYAEMIDGNVVLCRANFSITPVIEEMRRRKYPEHLIQYYLWKQK